MQAYPLTWPEGWPRTPAHKIENSRFQVTPDAARRGMLAEIQRLVGHTYRRSDVIISTNLRLRQDGEPYASQRAPDDEGVAVYFKYKGRPMVFACDRWSVICHNMHSITKTIEAMRGIERWGASDMLERAFKGFVAIEHQATETWREVLQIGPHQEGHAKEWWLAKAEHNFRVLASAAHPDKGGSAQKMTRLIKARDQAREELKP